MNVKFELTDESKVNEWGVTLWSIRATEGIPRHGVRKGDLGGWVESVDLANGNGRVSGNGRVFGNGQVFGNGWVFGDGQVSGDGQVERSWHILVVGPIGSENVTATLVRTKTNKHMLTVGCWTGTLGTLMAEVKRRRDNWTADEATQAVWMGQYKALKALGKATVARWEDPQVKP